MAVLSADRVLTVDISIQLPLLGVAPGPGALTWPHVQAWLMVVIIAIT